MTGTVTDANDQRPIEGATLTARQGATVIGTTNSAADGRFSLRLKVGSYTVEAAKPNYLTQQRAVELTAGGQSVQLDAVLATAVADLNTTALSFLGNEGQLRTQRVTMSNPSTSGVTLTYSLAVNQGWLWTVPASGSVPPGGSRTLTVRVDAAGLPTGVVHTGSIAFTTNAGRAPALQIPVTLVVPGYRQGLRSGGDTPYVDSFDDPWAADKAWTPGDFGYLGAGWINTSSQPIAGTDDDALYRTQREASSGYRFDDLPAGTYGRVERRRVPQEPGCGAPHVRRVDQRLHGAGRLRPRRRRRHTDARPSGVHRDRRRRGRHRRRFRRPAGQAAANRQRGAGHPPAGPVPDVG